MYFCLDRNTCIRLTVFKYTKHYSTISRNHSNGGAALRDGGERRSARVDWIIGCQAKTETRALNQRARECHPPYQRQCARPTALAAGAGAKRFESVLHPRALTTILVASVFTRGFCRSFGRWGDRRSDREGTIRSLAYSLVAPRTTRDTATNGCGWQMVSGDDRDDGGGGVCHATVIK